MSTQKITNIVLFNAFVALVSGALPCQGAAPSPNQRPIGKLAMSGQAGELPEEMFYEITDYLDPAAMTNLAVAFSDLSPTIAHHARGREHFFQILKKQINQHNGNLKKTLFDAISRGYPEAVDIVGYLARRIDIENATDEYGYGVLIQVIIKNNVMMLNQLIQAGLDINKQIIKGAHAGQTPLTSAAINGKIDIINQLIKTPGIDLNATNSDGYTALQTAGFMYNERIINIFKQASAPKRSKSLPLEELPT